jgi:hypothetical protein
VNATVQTIDATTLQILTPGGTVTVNTSLVNVQTNQPVVVVEVEPGRDWDIEVRDRLSRTDVTLTKREEMAT